MSILTWLKMKLVGTPAAVEPEPARDEEPGDLRDIDELPAMPDDSGFFEAAAIAAAKREAAAREADKLSYASCNGRMERVTQIMRASERRLAVRRVADVDVDEDRRGGAERRRAN